MPANSVPSPTRLDRFAPTSPSGCGASAALSNGADAGSTVISEPRSSTGPQRYPAQGLVSATFSSPSVRRPQRRGLTSRVGTPLRSSPLTRPEAGCIATYGAWALIRVTCSTPSASVTWSRDRVPCPS